MPHNWEELDLTWVLQDGQLLVALSYPVTELVARDKLQGAEPFRRLTRAEWDILEQIVARRSNAEISRQRATSARTVANQIAGIFRKLGIGSRRELTSLVDNSSAGNGELRGGPDPDSRESLLPRCRD